MWRLPGGDDDLFEDDEDMMLYAAAAAVEADAAARAAANSDSSSPPPLPEDEVPLIGQSVVSRTLWMRHNCVCRTIAAAVHGV